MHEVSHLFCKFALHKRETMKSLMIIMLLALLPEQQKAMLHLSGASSMEEIDEDVLSRFERLSAHPLDLNNATRSTLLASGLFSAHQLSALLAYRSSSGDILSFTELGMIDGFLPEDADALRYFVCLISNHAPGSRQNLRYSHELRLNAGLKQDGSHQEGFRYEGRLGDRAELLLGPNTLSAAYYGRRSLGKLVLGNFNARFGQGLLVWSGFQMSGYSSIASFARRASGISATSSTLADNFGIACDWNLGSGSSLSLGYSFRGKEAVANFTRVARNCTAGLSATLEGLSADFLLSLPAVALFGECACRWDGAPAVLLGGHWTPEYGRRYAAQLRFYDTEYKQYSGIAAGAEIDSWLLTADWGYRLDKGISQTKILARYSGEYALDSLHLSPSLMAKCRYRPGDTSPLRLELRTELGADFEGWMLNLRADLVYCRSLAWLWYIEAGRKADAYGCYLRAGLFKADNWDDRIYVYERNAPGAFSVPAYYGRGWAASLYAYWHINRRHSVYLRLEKTDFPWNLFEKPGKSALKLQYRHRF